MINKAKYDVENEWVYDIYLIIEKKKITRMTRVKKSEAQQNMPSNKGTLKDIHSVIVLLIFSTI